MLEEVFPYAWGALSLTFDYPSEDSLTISADPIYRARLARVHEIVSHIAKLCSVR